MTLNDTGSENYNVLLSLFKKNNKLLKIEKLVFYLLLLFLPTQFGKHFWPDFSLILGARIDYLSPTLYLTDILILILLFLWLKKQIIDFNIDWNSQKVLVWQLVTSYVLRQTIRAAKPKTKTLNVIILSAFTIFLLFGILHAKSPPAGFYGLAKLLEFIFFGFYVSRNIRSVKEVVTISFIFSFGILFESFLAIAQVINSGSLNGIFYLFGERTFNSQTLGIANASINGELILRPYATFPHPNVLAAFLLIGMTIVISIFHFPFSNKFSISKFQKIIFVLALGFGTVALFLTMSRIAILLWIIIFLFKVSKSLLKSIKFRKSKLFPRSGISLRSTIILFVFIGIVGGILLLSPIRYRFLDLNLRDESVVVRTELIKSSISMIERSPIFGAGLNNFLQNLPNNQNLKNQNIFTSLQPVHNIYLLIWSQLGTIGFAFFIWFVFKTISKIKYQISKTKNKLSIFNSQLSILTVVLILGLFDHYFLTIQQGQLLFSFVLGFCWAKDKI